MADIKNNKTTTGEQIVIEDAFDNGSYELGVTNRLNEISALTQQRENDYSLLSGYVYGNANASDSSFDISKFFSDVIAQLEKIKEQMQAEMNWEKFVDTLGDTFTSAFQAGRENAMDKLTAMLDPLTAAVVTLQDAVLTKMGIPDIPVIGNIQQILVKLGDIGRVVSRLPAETRAQARKAAKEEEEKKGGSALARLYENSILEKIVNQLVDLFWQALDLLKQIINCIYPFLLMMLIEKLKPVIEFFSLALGEIVGIAENAYTVAKMIIFNQAQLLNLFAETIRSKVEELWDVVRFFIHGGSLPNDAMISAVAMDIICCDFQIKADNLDINLIQANQELYSKKVLLEKLEKMWKNHEPLSHSQYTAMNSGIPFTIKQYESILIPKYGEWIENFNKNKKEDFNKQYEELVSENLTKKLELEREAAEGAKEEEASTPETPQT